MSAAGKSKDHNVSKKPGEMDSCIGSRLRLWRRTMNVDAYALAARVGITYQQLQKYEKGVNRISAARLFAIAQELKVPIDFFYKDAEPRQSEISGLHNEGDEGIDRCAFLSNGAGAAFLKCYVSIKKPGIRKALLNLMRSIVSECAADGTAVP